MAQEGGVPGPANYGAPPPPYPAGTENKQYPPGGQQYQGGGQQYPAGGQQYPAGGQQYPNQQYQGHPPPPPGYAGHSNTTVVIQQPGGYMVGGRMGPNPCTTTCQYCQANVTTATSRSCGGFVWMIAGIICLVGLFFMGITWLGCCLIPFCIPSLYDTTHTCPNCGKVLGEYTHF